MQQITNPFMRNPGGENEGGGIDPQNEQIKSDEPIDLSAPKKEEKGFFGKIKDALQDWSNVDNQEQEEDDASPIT